MTRASTLALGCALWALPTLGLAQVDHRRPMGPAPDVRYGFDNNSGGGCRDYNCGSRCYDGHRGTDFSVGVGTSVLASADGTVVATNNGCADFGGLGSTCGGRCGNYVQIQHADGRRTLFCHMRRNSLRVSRGQRVRCGQVVGQSASSGNSSGPHLHVSWQTSGVSRDMFRGRCSSSPGAWTDQRAYPQSPGDRCACVPSAEACDGRDNDCDGRVDDGLSRACYTGPSGTSGRGVCRGGTQTCSAGRWGACSGQVLPRTETCNRADDDCDGRVDDGVCVMDAGTPPRDVPTVRVDVAVARDVAADAPARDVVAEATPEDVATDEDAAAEDVTSDDASVEDASEDNDVAEDVEFDEDVPPGPDADELLPEDPERLDGGCGCRTRPVREGPYAALALVFAAFARRRRRFPPR